MTVRIASLAQITNHQTKTLIVLFPQNGLPQSYVKPEQPLPTVLGEVTPDLRYKVHKSRGAFGRRVG